CYRYTCGELGNRYVLTRSRGGSLEEGIHQYVYLDAQDVPVIHTAARRDLKAGLRAQSMVPRRRRSRADALASLGAPQKPDVEVGGSVAFGVRGLFTAGTAPSWARPSISRPVQNRSTGPRSKRGGFPR